MIKFDVLNRWTGKVQFTADIESPEDAPTSWKLRLAVEWGIKTRANLTDADLTDADLTRANLTRANLTDANLTRADLTRADLQSFKQDLIAEILKLPNELENLREKIVAGEIDGTTYSVGGCSCLAGTIAAHRGLLEPSSGDTINENGLSFNVCSSSPRERWFLMITPGKTPEDWQPSKMALDWVDEAIAIRDHIRATAPEMRGA